MGDRVLVCGSRSWTDHRAIGARLAKLADGTRILHGGARGVDTLAGQFANALGFPVSVYFADWEMHGKAAGLIRNQKMLDEGRPCLVIAFWDGTSRGTKDMIARAEKAGVLVEVHRAGPSEGEGR